jgi:formylglycine-generating enzyme required for sulfatase activity
MRMNFEPEMIVIPAGEFLMGCETGAANERPPHHVWVDRFPSNARLRNQV